MSVRYAQGGGLTGAARMWPRKEIKLNQSKSSAPVHSRRWRKTWEAARGVNLANATEVDLRYKSFGVNVSLVMGETEIVSPRRFVTPVDSALSIRNVMESIVRGEDSGFGFTESEEIISFRKEGDRISVISSTKPVRSEVTADELISEFSHFLWSAHSFLLNELPDLGGNAVAGRMVEGLAPIELNE